MKFLDLAGVQSLWKAIKAETAKSKTTVEGESAHATNAYVSVDGAAVTGEGSDGHTNYVVELHNAASTTDVTSAINTLKGDATSTGDTLGKLENRVKGLETGASVTITEVSSGLDAGVLKAYEFTQNGTSIGTVNIPKDFLVKSGSVRTIGSSEATEQMPEGTKVLDFVVNTVEGDETPTHIIIPVSDLVDVYTGGNGIQVSVANVISAVVDATNDEGYLTSGDNGLYVSGVDQAISDAVDAAKAELIGDSETDTASSDTIEGAKKYADSIVADKNVTATGDSYVSATAANNQVTVAATSTTKASLALADSALQGVDSTPAGTNVQVTLGKSGKNVTVAVDETELTSALANKVDKVEGSSLMTQAEHDKLAAIEADADVNVIETIKVDNVALTPDANKAVNIDLSGKADKVAHATSGNFAGLDANGNLTDSGSKAADFAKAAQGALADSAIQSVTGEDDITGGNDKLVAVTASTNASHAVTLASKVKTQAVATAVASTADGLATAADVKSYVDGKTTIAAHTESAAAPSETTPTGTMVVSSVTTENGSVKAVGSIEVEAAGAAAAVESKLRGASSAPGYSATETLATLRSDINAISGGGEGSIADQIKSAINDLDSTVDVNLSGNTVPVYDAQENTAYVLTAIAEVDGVLNQAASKKVLIEPIDTTTLNSILV